MRKDLINEEIIELFKQGKTQKEIAQNFHCSQATLSRKIKTLKELGLIDENIINQHNSNVSIKLSNIDNQILELLKQRKTQNEIANILNCSLRKIGSTVKKLKETGIINEDYINEQLIELIRQGKTCKEISEELQYSISTVSRKINSLKKKNILFRTDQIIELFRQGKTYKQIGDLLNLSEETIQKKVKSLKISGDITADIIKEREKNKKYALDSIDKEIIKFYNLGYSRKKIAEILNIPENSVCSRISRLKKINILKLTEKQIEKQIEKQNNIKNFDYINNQIIELYKKGFSRKKIESILNLTKSNLSYRINYLKRIGLLPDDEKQTQEQNTPEAITFINAEIIKLYNEGYSQTEISKKLNRSCASISRRIKNLSASGMLHSNIQETVNVASFPRSLKKAKSIYHLDSTYQHSFFSKSIEQAKILQEQGKLNLEQLDILADALLIEAPLFKNAITIARLYVGIQQYQKCIKFLNQSKEFFDKEKCSKIDELLSEIKKTIEDNYKASIKPLVLDR